MDTKAKRRQALDIQIEARKEAIVNAAIQEFIENGIDNSKISDIAKRAEVGTITVYRYFENKPTLVIECATKLWESETEKLRPLLFHEGFSSLNGFKQASHILSTLASLYEYSPIMLRLLEQFDNYTVREQITKEQLVQYESGIMKIRAEMLESFRKGQEDGSIRTDIDSLKIYATATHAIISLSQKLLLRGEIIQSDLETGANLQLKLLADMVLNYIKAGNEV
ncbi:MAG: TetR/AcrR family transcriptional regulator [Clostridia bacterium]|nr:TetR/AcrR family transcriptional regulator [Clostridia bacterium]